MKCFVIAMEKEAKPIISAMKISGFKRESGKSITYGTLFLEEVCVLVCGVGKVNAASGAQYAIDKLGADVIINYGVAGGLKADLKVGRTYAVSEVVQYDFDLTQLNGGKIGTLNECTENYLELGLARGFELKRAATGDRFNDDPQDFALLIGLGADIRDMELGAIAQVCMHANVKCYAFKTISDIYGSGSTTEQYYANLGLCFKNFSLIIKDVLESVI